MKPVEKMKALWLRMKIRERMIVLFVCLSLIPMLLVGALFYNNMNAELRDEYSNVRQVALEHAWWNYEKSLRRVESLGNLLQSNQEMREYLSGNILNVGEEVYMLLSYVQPMINYSMMSYDEVQEIRIYNNKNYRIYTGTPMRPLEELDAGVLESVNQLSLDEAHWIEETGEAGQLRFKMYRKLFNFRNARECGILELEVKPDQLLHFFEEDDGIRVFFELNDNWWTMENGQLTRTEKQELSGIVNTIDLGDPVGRVVSVSEAHREQSVKIWQFVAEFLVLFMLSAVQFLIFNFSFAKRLRLFTAHMTKRRNDLVEYEESEGGDEIDQTIQSYNEQIRRIRESVEREYVLALRNKEIEYYALQAQINPHFIYNTLENIRMNSMLNGDPSTPEMLCALGEYVRYNAHAMAETTLWWEMENVRQYLRIFSFRTGGQFTFTEQIGADIERLVCPQFILQPVVENAVDHGFANVLREKEIRIRVFEEQEYVYVEIGDNGVGIEPAALAKLREELSRADEPFQKQQPGESGIGLRNVNQRIKLFYGVDCGLSVESEMDRGTQCTLKIKKIVRSAD